MSKKKPWTICPECGCKPGEYHKAGCLRRKAPTIMDYRAPGNRGVEHLRRVHVPLQPVTEECGLCGASTPRKSGARDD